MCASTMQSYHMVSSYENTFGPDVNTLIRLGYSFLSIDRMSQRRAELRYRKGYNHTVPSRYKFNIIATRSSGSPCQGQTVPFELIKYSHSLLLDSVSPITANARYF